MLKEKTVVLGVTGSIAAYKAVDLASKLVQAGARVRVVMTKSATELVKPITFQAITMNPVSTEMFVPAADASITHVSLGEAADVLVIAPATANIIAKIANGIADDLLTCTVLATRAPVIVAPAMHTAMWENTITQENIAKLKARGFIIIEPESGRLASGGIGAGRLPATETILGVIRQVLGNDGDFAGKKVVVTAGGTQEAIDPVRYVGNRSSGKMGYAIAEAARDRGADVTLITAPSALSAPMGVEVIKVTSALEMKEAVDEAVKGTDALIMAAAVADYQPQQAAEQKIKKNSSSLKLELVKTPDILASVQGNFIKVGFAAESQDLIENARKKLVNKKLDLMVANDITAADSGFGADSNRVVIIEKSGRIEELPLLPKREVADRILDKVIHLISHPAKKDMKIKAVLCKTQEEFDTERDKASEENRIFVAIRPKEGYKEIIFDIFTVDPMTCCQLTEEGFIAAEDFYHAYVENLQGEDKKQFESGVDVSLGPQSGTLAVLDKDVDSIVGKLLDILNNRNYWESYG